MVNIYQTTEYKKLNILVMPTKHFLKKKTKGNYLLKQLKTNKKIIKFIFPNYQDALIEFSFEAWQQLFV